MGVTPFGTSPLYMKPKGILLGGVGISSTLLFYVYLIIGLFGVPSNNSNSYYNPSAIKGI